MKEIEIEYLKKDLAALQFLLESFIEICLKKNICDINDINIIYETTKSMINIAFQKEDFEKTLPMISIMGNVQGILDTILDNFKNDSDVKIENAVE